jgi:hypothetical protein
LGAADVRGEVEQAVEQLNSSSAYFHDEVHRCRLLFDALNVLWTAHRRACDQLDQSDTAAFRDLVLHGVAPEHQRWLCQHASVAELAAFRPQVLDHDVLRRSSDYAAGRPVPAGLEREATHKHGQLIRAFERWSVAPSKEEQIALLKKLVQLLYVVRSNIAHGEKLLRPRDREVCAATMPATTAIIEALFDHPSTRLATYGTLSPGEEHNSLLDEAPGKWSNGMVKGVVEEVDGLPIFQPQLDARPFPVRVLSSEALRPFLPRLDSFEGNLYERILIAVEQPDGKIVIASIYARAR